MKSKSHAPKSFKQPIKVLVGYLSEVTEKDAKTFAMSVAERHNTSLDISWWFVMPFDNGYLYEVHEGGSGKAFMPSVVKYFQTALPASPDEPIRAYIPSATRTVQVDKEIEGLSAMLLPESATEEASDFVAPSASMHAAIPERKGVLIVGGVFLFAGFVALGVGATKRHQNFIEPPPPAPIKADLSILPIGQKAEIYRISAGGKEYVTALKFSIGADGQGKWEVLKKAIEKQAPPPAPAPMPQPGAEGATPATAGTPANSGVVTPAGGTPNPNTPATPAGGPQPIKKGP